MSSINHKKERDKDIDEIKSSSYPRKIIVGGPGTGKSYLFGKLIEQKKDEGKINFLAITFIGKLGDALADDLCGLAKTTTMHSFARSFVLENCKNFNYYPKMYELIAEDLESEGIIDFEIGDNNYKKKTKYYRAVGYTDVVYYAIQICKKHPEKIPIFDLILIDEYQDFNSIESEFVDLLAQKNEIVIVGDDDQALYAFKGSSPAFIREKYDPSNTSFESHSLRFCSRCTDIIINYFHALIEKFDLNKDIESDVAKRRIKKDFICYVPDKDKDSKLNQRIHLIKNCPVGMIAYKIRKELEKFIEKQKVKNVLVIGEGQSCAAMLKMISRQLKNYGFRQVDYKEDKNILNLEHSIIDAYKFIKKDNESILGWRILKNPVGVKEKGQHLKNAATLATIIKGNPSMLEKIKDGDIRNLENVIEEWDKTIDRNTQNEKIRKDVLIQEIKRNNLYLPRPIRNLDITVCNILNSKGLGADIVFLIGFDLGKFPSKTKVAENEIYQMLVAVTRAKKRIYMINTIGKQVSDFVNCLASKDWEIESMQIK